MQITPENLQRLRTALRELQQVLDDIDAEQEAEQASQVRQVNYPVLKGVINEFLDGDDEAPQQTQVVIMPDKNYIDERTRLAKEQKPDDEAPKR